MTTRNIPVVPVEYYDTKAWIRNTATVINKLVNESNIQTPVGVVQSYLGAAAPTGWLICDGSDVSRLVYGDLFNVIGTTYGAGDGSNTFGLPDLRDRLLIGANTLAALGVNAGASTVELTQGNIPDYELAVTDPEHTHIFTADAHNHGITDAGHSHGVTDPGHVHGGPVTAAVGTEYDNTSANDGVTGDTASATTGISIDSATTGVTVDNETVTGSNASSATGISVNSNGSGDDVNILNPVMGVTWIIKT